jgi:hypothetical protein
VEEGGKDKTRKKIRGIEIISKFKGHKIINKIGEVILLQ